ncbi:MAG: AMIN domain-containing protein [Campylobacterales bacterium]|nr:AMIN domain-containing protein [Campylobacterales bacterium]
MDSKKNGVTTNEVPKKDFLSKESINLPNSARKIKSFVIEYQNLDGSIDRKILKLDKDIDWHFPILISQDVENKDEIKEENKKSTEKYIKVNDSLAFSIEKNSFEIFTKDTLLREFALTDPMKIVCDFQKNTQFNSKSYKLQFLPFKEVIIGNHTDFYRFVIELDGQYRYKISKTDYGYKINVE